MSLGLQFNHCPCSADPTTNNCPCQHRLAYLPPTTVRPAWPFGFEKKKDRVPGMSNDSQLSSNCHSTVHSPHFCTTTSPLPSFPLAPIPYGNPCRHQSCVPLTYRPPVLPPVLPNCPRLALRPGKISLCIAPLYLSRFRSSSRWTGGEPASPYKNPPSSPPRPQQTTTTNSTHISPNRQP
jgi:hypothetical protein